MKLFIVKYLFAGRKYAVRVCATNREKAADTVDCMTKGHIYSVREVIT